MFVLFFKLQGAFPIQKNALQLRQKSVRY